MWKVTTEKFKKPKEGGTYISEITRIVPERHIHPKSVFIDLSKVDKETASNIRREIKKSEKTRRNKRGNKPIDYGIKKEQFYQILDKASKPIKEYEERKEDNQ